MSIAIAATKPEIVIKAPELRGGNLALMACRDLEVTLEGPAGSGKTIATLLKIHLMLLAYPDTKALVARKTNTALAGSAIATYRDYILDPREGVRYFGGNKVKPAAFEYPNGSVMIVNGLDKPDKIKSWEFSLAYINEATECTEEDIEFVRSRLRQGKTPYHQLIMDVNPDAPTHWLNQRMNEGTTTRLLSRHEDNPRFYDTATQNWTEEGYNYIEGVLGGLTGVRLARLRYGIWAAASGTIYEDAWDRARNVVDPFPIPPEYPRYLGVDFGYIHPFVCLWAAIDPDGRIIIYRQIYKTKTLVEDHAKQIKHLSRWGQDGGDPLPREIICDHDAEDRATLERHLGLMTMPAHKNVSAGIQAVASRFKAAGNGKPRIVIFRDSLKEVDRELMLAKKPSRLEDEPDVYVWDTRQGMKKGEAPLKESDDGCLVAGTMVTTSRGDVPIEQIAAGDYVLTRNGYKRVIAAGMTQRNAEVFTVTLSNGATLTGTGDHPVYLSEQGYTPLRALRYGDIIEDSKPYTQQYTERYPLSCQSLQQSQKLLSTRELSSDGILNRCIGLAAIITDQMQRTLKRVYPVSMSKSGKTLMEPCQQVMKFTTKIITRSTMLSKIWNAFQKKIIRNAMNFMRNRRGVSSCEKWLRRKSKRLLKLGTNQKRVESGTNTLVASPTRMQSIRRMYVNIVDKSLSHATCVQVLLVSAPITANHMRGVTQELITRHARVNCVDVRLSAIAMLENSTAHPPVIHNINNDEKNDNANIVGSHSQLCPQNAINTVLPHVLTITCITDRQPVYNLTVDNTVGEGEYFANGILVHNCDTLRYLTARFDLRPTDITYSSRIY